MPVAKPLPGEGLGFGWLQALVRDVFDDSACSSLNSELSKCKPGRWVCRCRRVARAERCASKELLGNPDFRCIPDLRRDSPQAFFVQLLGYWCCCRPLKPPSGPQDNSSASFLPYLKNSPLRALAGPLRLFFRCPPWRG